jgi:formylglycine-generating enzyme required for sulfatase activity
MEFVLVPRGKAWLGGGHGQPGIKKVEIPDDFYLGVYLVTQQEWEAVTGVAPSSFSRGNEGQDAVKDIPDTELKRFPVEAVSWDDAQLFLKYLNVLAPERGWVYRLPSETEWEYACRGGPMADPSESGFDYYLDRPTLDLSSRQANFDGSAPGGRAREGPVLRRPSRVGSYPPSPWGLCDMHGNLWEWCEDSYDGSGDRVLRGGAWNSSGLHCRAAFRHRAAPGQQSDFVGLRVARVPSDREPEPLPPRPAVTIQTIKSRLGIEFVRVPAGRAWLGGGRGRPGDRLVDISYDYYLSKYEVTQEEWSNVTFGKRPSHHQGRVVAGVPKTDVQRFPVENVSWDDTQAFLRQLNARDKVPGWIYRLPKEAEWEYACRGGPMQDRFDGAFDFYFEQPTNDLRNGQANCKSDAPAGQGRNGQDLDRTCRVGSYRPNRLGLYDMHGNVWEWCQDNMDGGSARIFRGGSYCENSSLLRTAARYPDGPASRRTNVGLRLARVPVRNK